MADYLFGGIYLHASISCSVDVVVNFLSSLVKNLQSPGV